MRLSAARRTAMFEEIERLVDLVAKSNVTEVSVQANGRSVTVRKSALPAHLLAETGTHPPGVLPPDGEAPPATAPCAGNSLVPTEEEPPTTPPEEPPTGLRWITAPMVGIFHPTEPPVTVGLRVESGQVVGLIESMKLMNDIRAEEGGLVCEVAIETGTPVEYGQPLFGLE